MGGDPVRSESAPTVVVWREYWLPRSETFIRDQMATLERWVPLRMGWRRLPSPLVEPDYAPYGPSFLDRVASHVRRSPSVRRRLTELIGDRRVGLVHAHFGLDGLSVLPYARRTGTPLLVTFHGMDVTVLPQRRAPLGWWYRRRLLTLFAQADQLIAVSDFVSDRLQQLGADPAKIRVHYMGTPIDPDDPDPVADQERSGIVFVGRLVAKKGVADLLHAVHDLPAPLNKTPITIVGYGPLEASLRELATELDVNAEFTGPQDSTAIEDILRRAAIFCGPSRTADNGDSEGLGRVFMEAARAGLPVVAYVHGGVSEAVQTGVTGILLEQRDVAGLSGALAQLLSDPALAARMGAAGRARVRRDFDMTKQTRQLELIYDEVSRRPR